MLTIKSIIATGLLLAVNSTGAVPLVRTKLENTDNIVWIKLCYGILSKEAVWKKAIETMLNGDTKEELLFGIGGPDTKCLAGLEYSIPLSRSLYEGAILLKDKLSLILNFLGVKKKELEEKDENATIPEININVIAKQINLLKRILIQKGNNNNLRMYENNISMKDWQKTTVDQGENEEIDQMVKNFIPIQKIIFNHRENKKIRKLEENGIPKQKRIFNHRENKKIGQLDENGIPIHKRIFNHRENKNIGQLFEKGTPMQKIVFLRVKNHNGQLKRRWVEVGIGVYKTEIFKYPPNKLSDDLKKLLAIKKAKEENTMVLNLEQ